jgi:hypothetical protein
MRALCITLVAIFVVAVWGNFESIGYPIIRPTKSSASLDSAVCSITVSNFSENLNHEVTLRKPELLISRQSELGFLKILHPLSCGYGWSFKGFLNEINARWFERTTIPKCNLKCDMRWNSIGTAYVYDGNMYFDRLSDLEPLKGELANNQSGGGEWRETQTEQVLWIVESACLAR